MQLTCAIQKSILITDPNYLPPEKTVGLVHPMTKKIYCIYVPSIDEVKVPTHPNQ